MKQQDFLLPAYNLIDEPELVFHPERENDKSAHPLKGLVNFGPYSRSLINNVVDPIRVASIFPHGQKQNILKILSELESHQTPKERKIYLIDFPGFSRVFGLRVVAANVPSHIELSQSLNDEMLNSERPHVVLAEKLNQAINALQKQRADFDVLLIYLPESWSNCFVVAGDEDFDLHDYLKAITATLGIPSQILRESKVLTYNCRASVMWRLGIALYTKAGGVPWKIASAPLDTAYIGLSYAVKKDIDQKTHFITCCSQVFDSDGAGLEFLTYDTDGYYVERDNPYLNHSEMRRLMTRSLALYQKRHNGRPPRKVVIHKSTEFKKSEIDGCFDAWKSSDGLELIQVQDEVSWLGILVNPPDYSKGEKKGKPNGYPCVRGSSLQLGGDEILLWTQGNAPSAVDGKNYFKEGKGIPMPLLLKRFAGHGTWDESCKSVLGLSKMNWNNDSLYDRLPVTMAFAKVLAQTIKHMPTPRPGPYEFRFFI